MPTVVDRAYVEIAPLFTGFSEKVKAGVVKGFAGVGPVVTERGREAGMAYSRGVSAGITEGDPAVVGAAGAQAAEASAVTSKAGAAGGKGWATSFVKGLGGGKLFAGTALIAGAISAVSLKLAGDFETAMTRLVTAAGEAPSALKEVSAGVLDISRTTGTSTRQLGASMYMIESAGYHGKTALNILKAAAQGAKVDMADAGVVANALTTAMNDLGKGAGPPALVMSQLVATVGRGKLTMDDLAASLHSVLPNAAALGLGMAQVGGAIATMTAQGISADQATQNLNHAILSLANPTAVQTKAMAAFGLNSSTVAKSLGKKGLAGTLEEISKAITDHMGPAGLTITKALNTSQIAAGKAKLAYDSLPPALRKLADEVKSGELSIGQIRSSHMGLTLQDKTLLQQWAQLQRTASGFSDLLKQGSPTALTYAAALAKMTGGQTGLQVALHLTGQNLPTYLANIKAIGAAHAEGAGDVEGWAIKQKTFNQRMSELKAVVVTAAISLGTLLLPAASALVAFILGSVVPAIRTIIHLVGDVLGPAFGAASRFVKEHKTIVETLVVILTVFVGVLKAVKLAIFLWTAATKAYIAVQEALNIVMDTNPIILVIAAIAALAAGFIYAYKHSETFRNIVDSIGRVLKSMFTAVYGFLKQWGPLILAVLAPVIGIPLLIWKYWRQIKDFMVKAFQLVVSFLKTWGPVILAVLMPVLGIPLLIFLHWRQIVDFLHNVWDGIVNFVKHWYHLILDILLPFLSVPALIYTHWSEIIHFMHQVWDGAVQAVRDGIATTIRVVRNGLADIVDFFQKLPGRILRFFVSAGRLLVAAGRAYINGLFTGIRAIWATVASWFSRLPGRIVAFFSGAARLLLGIGKSIIQGLWNGQLAIWRQAAEWLSRVPGAILGFFHDLPHKLYGAGKDILAGLWKGLRVIWNDVVSWFSKLPGRILNVLGIHSPPDWAIDAGMHMMKGILRGIVMHAGGPLAFMDRWQEAMAKKSRQRFDVGIFQIPGLGGIFSGGTTGGKGSMGHPWDWIAQAMTLTHAPSTWMDAIFRRIMFESSGNPNAINLTDANAAAGHPSKGIMQMIDTTFSGYALPGHSNIWNPVDNIASAIRYIANRYGSISAIDPPVQGYRVGAWDIARDQLAYLHKREMVVPAATAEQVRKAGSRPGGNDDALIMALIRALSQVELRFDGDGLARFVTKKQNANNVKGVRR